MQRAITEGECKIVIKDGEKWVYKCVDRHVHKKGWSEATNGNSTARMVEDQDYEGLTTMMKKAGWEFSLGALSQKQEKALEDHGTIPDTKIDSLKKATNVLV